MPPGFQNMVMDSPLRLLESLLGEPLELGLLLVLGWPLLRLQSWKGSDVHCPPFLGRDPHGQLLMVEAPLPGLAFCQGTQTQETRL